MYAPSAVRRTSNSENAAPAFAAASTPATEFSGARSPPVRWATIAMSRRCAKTSSKFAASSAARPTHSATTTATIPTSRPVRRRGARPSACWTSSAVGVGVNGEEPARRFSSLADSFTRGAATTKNAVYTKIAKGARMNPATASTTAASSRPVSRAKRASVL